METDIKLKVNLEGINVQNNIDSAYLPIIMSNLEIDPTPSTSSHPEPSSSLSSLRNLQRRKTFVEAKNKLHKINRRVISKPKKTNYDFSNTERDDIHNYYLNNKLDNHKSTNLETIFEEPKLQKNKSSLVGIKKLKRSMSVSDGLNSTKTTIKNRRKRIKRFLGKSFKINKMSMESFMIRLESLESCPINISDETTLNHIDESIETQSDNECQDTIITKIGHIRPPTEI